MREFFLKSNNSCFSNDVESNLNVNLSTKIRLLPNEDISTYFSLNEQYNKERDECNSFRLIFNINPICSNVLYNSKTEIVIDEGSNNVKVIYEGEGGSKRLDELNMESLPSNSNNIISYMLAIRNTEYSHPKLGDFTYHCGYNIFNNHMLRNNGFVHINKALGNSENYNTISDFLRNSKGEIITQDINISYDKINKTQMHLYHFDSIISFKNAFLERCEERDGWWGFINPSNINISNRFDGTDILTNKLINNKKACDFIDLYPDRSLYSFIPKYNKYKKRLEKNWDYCITYPFKNDYDKINEICGGRNGAIRANFYKTFNSSGLEILQCESYFAHNLKVGDYINIYYSDGQGEGVLKVKVESIGDSLSNKKDKIFNIKYSNISSIYELLTDNHFFYKKISEGITCLYYFRQFKKIKNINGEELKSDINKVAFGKNIYGDETAQIIFTDNIDINGLIDNNGRPVSSVYLTIIKRNAGFKKWYLENNFNDNSIEYSHCFGEVTSGLDFSGIKDEPFDYNIHRLHNLVNNYQSGSNEYRTFELWGNSVENKPSTIESDITIDNDIFYGDVVEYDISKAKETIISKVYHRVNTAQREVFNEIYRDILQDKIVSDDYDSANGNGNNFEVKTYYINDIFNSENEKTTSTVGNVYAINNNESGLVFGNIVPEGNYYNPHIKIDLKLEDEEVTEAPAKLLNYGKNNMDYHPNDKMLIIRVPTNYGFYKGDFICFYNEGKDNIWGEIIKTEDNGFVLHIKLDKEGIYKDSDLLNGYWSPNNVPIYAKLLVKQRKFVWRKLLKQSELKPTSLLFNTTFSNGCLYIEKNINFFLRRQDPFGTYGLSVPLYSENKTMSNPLDDYNVPGEKQFDYSGLIFANNKFDNCY